LLVVALPVCSHFQQNLVLFEGALVQELLKLVLIWVLFVLLFSEEFGS
jgi:hypothetical protein